MRSLLAIVIIFMGVPAIKPMGTFKEELTIKSQPQCRYVKINLSCLNLTDYKGSLIGTTLLCVLYEDNDDRGYDMLVIFQEYPDSKTLEKTFGIPYDYENHGPVYRFLQTHLTAIPRDVLLQDAKISPKPDKPVKGKLYTPELTDKGTYLEIGFVKFNGPPTTRIPPVYMKIDFEDLGVKNFIRGLIGRTILCTYNGNHNDFSENFVRIRRLYEDVPEEIPFDYEYQARIFDLIVKNLLKIPSEIFLRNGTASPLQVTDWAKNGITVTFFPGKFILEGDRPYLEFRYKGPTQRK